jgi:serine/threonine protein phosphatase PrpC
MKGKVPVSDTYPTAVEGLKLLHASLSDVGQRRTRNEDTIGFFEPADRSGPYLVVVADGVGGSNAGEVASQLAVETVSRMFFVGGDPENVGGAISQALQVANDAIVSEAAVDPRKAGMCTTCTCAAIRGNTLVIGHLGDCTAYMAIDGVLVKLTNDHSLAEEYAQQGREVPPDQAHLANVLTRWLGVEGGVQADISEVMQFDDENTLVICSDGMTKVVQEAEILRTVSMHLPGAACRRLVKTANDNGGPDNISVQVVRLTRF